MADYILRLYTDVLAENTTIVADNTSTTRCFYILNGIASITTDTVTTTLSQNSAWFPNSPVSILAGKEGAQILRFELVSTKNKDIEDIKTDNNVTSTQKITADIALVPGDHYLLRGDRVDIPTSGIAYPHVHQGPGIRCLIDGAFSVETGGVTHEIATGDAWFEAGPEPVKAWAPDDDVACFYRVMVLPRSLKGKSSISYINEEDNDKPKRQKYTIFIDHFIEI